MNVYSGRVTLNGEDLFNEEVCVEERGDNISIVLGHSKPSGFANTMVIISRQDPVHRFLTSNGSKKIDIVVDAVTGPITFKVQWLSAHNTWDRSNSDEIQKKWLEQGQPLEDVLNEVGNRSITHNRAYFVKVK